MIVRDKETKAKLQAIAGTCSLTWFQRVLHFHKPVYKTYRDGIILYTYSVCSNPKCNKVLAIDKRVKV
jgi:hypothetical protein